MSKRATSDLEQVRCEIMLAGRSPRQLFLQSLLPNMRSPRSALPQGLRSCHATDAGAGCAENSPFGWGWRPPPAACRPVPAADVVASLAALHLAATAARPLAGPPRREEEQDEQRRRCRRGAACGAGSGSVGVAFLPPVHARAALTALCPLSLLQRQTGPPLWRSMRTCTRARWGRRGGRLCARWRPLGTCRSAWPRVTGRPSFATGPAHSCRPAWS